MKKKVLKLPEGHGWRCQPGHKIFVADRGAVRFDYPESWVITPSETSIKFHNKKPPDDDCVLEVTVFQLSPQIDWSALPLASLLRQATAGEDGPAPDGPVVEDIRDDLELVWTEQRSMDPELDREAVHRTCLARTRNTRAVSSQGVVYSVRPDVQALMTLAFWPEDQSWVDPAWQEVLRSLQLGIMVRDPFNRNPQ